MEGKGFLDGRVSVYLYYGGHVRITMSHMILQKLQSLTVGKSQWVTVILTYPQ